MNNYFAPISFFAKRENFVFPCSLARTTYELEHPWYLSSHGDLLCVCRSNFLIFQYILRSSTREQHDTITVSNFFTLGIDIFGFYR